MSETHRFSPQMRLITYPDHKTTQKSDYNKMTAAVLVLIERPPCGLFSSKNMKNTRSLNA